MSQDSQTLEQKFDRLDQKFDTIDLKIDTLTSMVKGVSKDIDSLALATGNGFKEVYKRIDELDERLSKRIDNLDIKIDGLENNLGSKIDKINSNTTGISTRVEVLEDSMRIVRGKLGLT